MWNEHKKKTTEPNDHLISILIGYKSLRESLAYLNDVHSHTHTNTNSIAHTFVRSLMRSVAVWRVGGGTK